MNTYPEYCYAENSRWFTELPSHWRLIKAKRIFRNIREKSDPTDKQLAASQKYGIIPQKEMIKLNNAKVMLALKGTENFKKVQKDDFVISLRSFEGGIEHSNHDGCITPAYTVLRLADKELSPDYFKKALKCQPFIEALNSASEGIRDGKSISFEEFGELFLAVPSFSEQTMIANFLDRELIRIDALVSEKQNFINLLEEKRQALISHVVNTGLDDSVEMKDSGVESIGKIPANWKIEKIKHSLRSVESGTSVNSESTPANDGKYGVLKTSCVSNGYFAPEENKQVINDDMSRVSCPVKANRLIVSRMNTPELVGASGYTDKSYPKLFLPDRLWQLEFNERVNTKYIFYWAQTASYRDQIKSVCVGTSSSMQNLSQDDFKNFKLPIPSKPTQDLIVEHIDKSNELINRVKLETLNSVALLRERRSALISAAVTGKIDVREEA